MAVDAAYVGRAFPAAEPYRVGREKMREFALAIGEGDSVCHDLGAARAAGHPDLVAPPTFAVVFTMPLMEALRDPAFGWDYARMVHGEQSFTMHRRCTRATSSSPCCTSTTCAPARAAIPDPALRGHEQRGCTGAVQHVVDGHR